ncbi:SLC13 family permease [Puniceicoccus vermicola]|nr:SLC13 family permease [Puniceicoccus vermicola]
MPQSPNRDPDRDDDLPGVLEAAPSDQHYRVQKDPKRSDDDHSREFGMRQRVGLFVGPLVFIVVLFLPAPGGMSIEAWRMAAVASLMAIWWISEAIPIPVTSLLPIVLFPTLGILPTPATTLAYGNHLIFLFMGGFIIALAMQRWNLHRRIALHIIKVTGFSAGRLVLGFMLATAILSAFVSNTATAVMMMPIGIAVTMQVSADLTREGHDAKKSEPLFLNLMLGIAYAASIGGMATLIGTPPNTVLASYLSKSFGYEITFAKWLAVGIPFTGVFLPLCWLWLTRIANPMAKLEVADAEKIVNDELQQMGKMSSGERWTAIVFALTGLAWIFRPTIAAIFPEPSFVKDSTIAIGGAVLLFLIPLNLRKRIFVMNWEWAAKLPWGVLILFGGGLALAEGFDASGLAVWVVDQVQILEGMPMIFIVIGVTTLVVFLTELTSNTATSAMLMPVLAGTAIGLGENPLLLLAPAALAASCAFMLPVATPPNAIVFGSGHVTIPQMARSGFGLNVIGLFLIPLVLYLLFIPIFGIVLGELPAWAR